MCLLIEVSTPMSRALAGLARPLGDERAGQIEGVTASFLVRSSSIRASIKRTTEYYRSRFGLATLMDANEIDAAPPLDSGLINRSKPASHSSVNVELR